jgi:hypothetical protein
MTVLGPLVTIGVALHAFGALGDRFDAVSRSGDQQALALELKFAVTDANGWQTAYGYDGGRSRDRFLASAESVRRLLTGACGPLSTPSCSSTPSPTAHCARGGRNAPGGSSSARRSGTSRPWPTPRTGSPSSRRSRPRARGGSSPTSAAARGGGSWRWASGRACSSCCCC